MNNMIRKIRKVRLELSAFLGFCFSTIVNVLNVRCVMPRAIG